MGKYVAEQTVKQMIAADMPVKGADVIVLGMTFKENCPDLRNSKVIDVINELKSFGARVHVHDPIASSAECEHEYGVALTPGTSCRAPARSWPPCRTGASTPRWA